MGGRVLLKSAQPGGRTLCFQTTEGATTQGRAWGLDTRGWGLSGADPPPLLPSVPGPCDHEDLLDGVIFGAKYLGSTQLVSERNPPPSTRMAQAREAMDRVKVKPGLGRWGSPGPAGGQVGGWAVGRVPRGPWSPARQRLGLRGPPPPADPHRPLTGRLSP